MPDARELDMLLTTGERISMALLAMAIKSMGFEARSYTGSQAGMITDARHGSARIVDVTPVRLREALDEGAIVIVAGFQGFNRDSRDITTLGRGGSDTTAVALAAALDADVCEIYTRRRRRLHRRSARRAARPQDRPRSRAKRCSSSPPPARRCSTSGPSSTPAGTASSCTSDPRSTTTRAPGSSTRATKERSVEEPIITGVAADLSEAKITVVGCARRARQGRRHLHDRRQVRRQHRHDRAERVGRDAGAPTSRSPCRRPRARRC